MINKLSIPVIYRRSRVESIVQCLEHSYNLTTHVSFVPLGRCSDTALITLNGRDEDVMEASYELWHHYHNTVGRIDKDQFDYHHESHDGMIQNPAS